jgi:signal transduction histidine kinase/CheY-like chemotaxis protein
MTIIATLTQRSYWSVTVRAVSLPLGMMAFAIVTLGLQVRQSISTSEWVDRVDLVIRMARLAFPAMVGTEESGTDTVLAKGYEGGHETTMNVLDRDLETLQELVVDDPEQEVRLRKVRDIRHEWEQTSKDLMQPSGIRSPALPVDLIATEKHLGADMRRLQEEFIRREETRRAARVQKARKNQLRTMATVTGLTFVMSGVFVLFARKQMLRLATEIAQSQEQVAQQISSLSAANQEKQRVAEQLHKTASYTRSLIEASLDPMATISRDGKITDVNTATEVVTGVSRQEMIGSDFRVLEEQLLQAQKLEAIGRLAAGLAHDFNNILSVILGTSELLQGDLQSTDAANDYLEDIKVATKYGASLTQQLLIFSRKHLFSPRLFDLNEIVQETSQFLSRMIGEHIHVKVILPVEETPILADPVQIQQVLINLATNARDAMTGGGELTIEVGTCVMKELGEASDLTPRHYITLRVSDTGVGMSPLIRSRAFDPFFTTKDIGKGTGLGLATVYGIVKQTGGSISVDSKLGEGTSLQIYLPRAVKGTRHEAAAWRLTDDCVYGSGNVLLVEDQNKLRNLNRILLRDLGYNVLDSGSPDEAIQIAQQFVGKIDLLLTDMVMPDMNGRDLAQRLRAFYPDMRVLYVSGFSQEIPCGENEAFMQKPVPRQALAKRIHELFQPSGTVSYTDTDKQRAS